MGRKNVISRNVKWRSWTTQSASSGLSPTVTRLGILVEIWDCWDWSPLEKSSKRGQVFFSFKPNHSVWGKLWYLRECFSYKANYLHWQLMILCLLRPHLSHLTHFPPIAPPHSFYYLSSLRALGLSLAIACAEMAEYNHSIFSFLFFALGEHSNSLYGWRPIQIRQRTGECVTLDRQPRESQVDTWQVIKSQLCPHVGGSAQGQMETVTVEV